MKWRSLTAAMLVAAVTWALLLAVSPALHQAIHADADRVEHTCVVTFFSSGTLHHAPPVTRIEPSATILSSEALSLRPQWVASPFLEARIFEHAPPVFS